MAKLLGCRVLVTGGTGFIGSHLVSRLVELGAEVAVFSLDGKASMPDGVKIFHGNIQDAPEVERAVGRFQPEHVFHLAAQPLVGIAQISVYDTLDTNIRGAINLLQAIHSFAKETIKSIVFISTDKVYGEFAGTIDEDAPLLGIGNPYDVSKVCADYLAQMYARVFRLPVVIVRSGNVYGEGDNNCSRLIPGTIKSIFKNESPIIRSNGDSTRDYVYVEDIVDAYLLLLDKVQQDSFLWGRAINVGSDRSYTVLEVVHLLLELSGAISLSPKIQNTAKNEIFHQHLNWDWIREMGWTPKTPLTEGLARCVSHYRKNLVK